MLTPGARAIVLDARRPANLKKMPFAEGSEVTVWRVSPLGNVQIAGVTGFWSPARFRPL